MGEIFLKKTMDIKLIRDGNMRKIAKNTKK